MDTDTLRTRTAFQTGHLIGASPRAQFWAQLAGSAGEDASPDSRPPRRSRPLFPTSRSADCVYASSTFFSVGFAFAPALFLVFSKAYPCINDATITKCMSTFKLYVFVDSLPPIRLLG